MARAASRDQWLHHPVIGDPSWDTFQREPGNPIYRGTPPFAWPVNGFLFHDPRSSCWYAYVGLYPEGYWPAGGCMLFKEDASHAWKNMGIVLNGDAGMYDGDGTRAGGTPDISVIYAEGKYHAIHDWADPTNHRGGLGYAWAESPEGPFHRSVKPVHEDSGQRPIMGRYVRAYAPTLFRRSRDWFILCMMSTPRNAGGTWALACMRAGQPEGPYAPPEILLAPQLDTFHPPLAEFYPAFLHESTVYAPATSVAKNRSFQVIYKAPLERAHEPAAWSIAQQGSAWHDEPGTSGEQGIWGQTFSGQVVRGADGREVLRALSFSKTPDNRGSVHLSWRPWNTPYKDGFILASAYAKSFAILPYKFGDFDLVAEIVAHGAWRVCWDCRGPLGPDKNGADAAPHPGMDTDRVEWAFQGTTTRIDRISPAGDRVTIGEAASVNAGDHRYLLHVVREGSALHLDANEARLFDQDCPGEPGRIELVADENASLYVNRFTVTGSLEPAWQPWLPEEGIAGAACAAGEWKRLRNPFFRFGTGYISQGPRSRAKWNVAGSKFRLVSPRHPRLGTGTILLDGKVISRVDFHAARKQASSVLLEFNATLGFHAIVLQVQEGVIPLDCLDVQREVEL